MVNLRVVLQGTPLGMPVGLIQIIMATKPQGGFPRAELKCLSLSGEITKEVNQEETKWLKEYT